MPKLNRVALIVLSLTAAGLIPTGCGRSTPPPVAEPSPPENLRLAEGVETLPGFQAEILYTVPGVTQGSWVSLCTGPGNTLFASAQNGGVFQITPPAVGDFETEPIITPVPVEVGNAHGLCWAFDSLYAMVSGSGLHRVTDADGDGVLDTDELILPLQGSGEHGPHAVIKHPDGESLLIVIGNHTEVPELTASRAPQVWDEDLLLPREWDARGHAAGVMAPGGTVYRLSQDASEVELISNGYRNSYDLAVSPTGEVFTFDSDMEWDLGMPWYRPTRLLHVTSGSEFGWRSGTGKWPTYFPDSLPSVADIGPGSPTGVVFGTGATFPAEYQNALFLCDWTFGTMYAVTLKEYGGSFYASAMEEFLSGKPLALTDLVIGNDGAMYFLTGGRGTQSHLYRVYYYGNRDTTPESESSEPNEDTILRRRLESWHHSDAPPETLDQIWDALGHEDRHVRFAARIALEHHPVENWISRLELESNPDRVIQGVITFARQGGGVSEIRSSVVLQALDRIDLSGCSLPSKVGVYRALSLVFSRLGEPIAETQEHWATRLGEQFPSSDDKVNAELARLLVYLEYPSIIEKCLEMIESDKPRAKLYSDHLLSRNDSYGGVIQQSLRNPAPTRGLHYAFILRTVENGWTESTRTRYITWLANARTNSGGASYKGFIDRMMQQSLEHCDEPLKGRLEQHAAVIAARTAPRPKAVAPTGPWRVWTIEDATATLADGMAGRDFDRGAGLYQAVGCVTCHQFSGYGESLGPDLTTVASRFSPRDILTATIDPSRDVSDQYAWSVVKFHNGERRLGRLVKETEDSITLSTNAFIAEDTVTIQRSEIESVSPHTDSSMPPGLINPLNEEDLRDLIAYLLSGGDPKHMMFEEADPG